MDFDLGFKICKYCGSYYSPEGTWTFLEDGEWVCQNCLYKEFENIKFEEEKEQKHLNLIQKLFARIAQPGRA